MNLAVVDDDAASAEQLLRLLAGRNARHYRGSAQLLQQLQQDDAALVIMPATLLASARAAALRETLQRSALPVLLVAARGDSKTLAAALSASPAALIDYVVAPVRRHALLLRVDVLLQRAYPQQALQEEAVFGPFVFRWPPATVTRNGEPVALTQKEFDLALLLLRHSDRPLSRAFILETLWPDAGDDVASRTLDTHISRVRTKLALQPRHGYLLSTVYGYGYQLEQAGPQTPAGPA